MGTFQGGYISADVGIGSNAIRTISFLAQRTGTPDSSYPSIFTFGSGTTFMALYSNNSNELRCTAKNSNTALCSTFPITSDLSALQHFTVIYDGSNFIAYCDGKYVNESSLSGEIQATSDIKIGKDDQNPAFIGYISEIKIWNRVLSADEIKAEADRCLAMVDNSGSVSAYGIKFTIDGGDNIPPQFNGTYTQSDVTATGTNRVWLKDDDPVYNVKYSQEDWYLFENDYDFEALARGENPWEDIVRSGVTVTVTE